MKECQPWLHSGPPRFEVIGEKLEDASERIGPLFSKPPKIHATDLQAWKEIKTIVLGEEGSGRGRWRVQFRRIQIVLIKTYILIFWSKEVDGISSGSTMEMMSLWKVWILGSYLG